MRRPAANPRRRASARKPALSDHVRAKNERMRRAVLDAAAATFAERGYFNATMKDIADRLQMRPGSLYHYWPSKDAALEEICRVSGVEFRDQLAAILHKGGPAAGMVREGILLHLTSERRAYVETFAFARRNLPPQIVDELNDVAREYRRAWRQIFELGQANGEWRPELEPAMAADAVLALCNGAAGSLARKSDSAVVKVAESLVDLFLQGALARR